MFPVPAPRLLLLCAVLVSLDGPHGTTLDSRTQTFLYALLFVDLKTSDHYRREQPVVRREVMRLAQEANNYFFQINLRLVVVDIVETFRDDLSLYSFEEYRNRRLGHLPFHNFAVLISYRYAGGLAFVGGMCSGKSVMLTGFYPHNPEAMASIFFHEVAHLIGVPHRPANEFLEVPNCACPGQQPAQRRMPPTLHVHSGQNVSRSSVIQSRTSAESAANGCLRIPGFDHDCSLQLMVNFVQRHNRCLPREPRANASSVPLCGNGVREHGEQCDCGLERLCSEWNCEPRTCSRVWPLWQLWLSVAALCSVLAVPPLGWLLLSRRRQMSLPGWAQARQQTMVGAVYRRMPFSRSLSPSTNAAFWAQRQRRHKANNAPLFARCWPPLWVHLLARPVHIVCAKFAALLGRKRGCSGKGKEPEQEKLDVGASKSGTVAVRMQRPSRAPPPPPSSCSVDRQLSFVLCTPSSTLGRPQRRPPPVPPAGSRAKSATLVMRPRATPPPPPLAKREESGEEEEDEWDDYCE